MSASHLDLRETHQIGCRTRESLVGPVECPALTDAGIELCGRSHAQRGFRFVRHHPRSDQILVCDEGHGKVLIAGAWRTCRAGQAYAMPRGCRHAYHADDHWCVSWVIGALDLVLPGPSLVAADAEVFVTIIDNLHRETWAGADRSAQACWTQLLRIQVRRAMAADDRLERAWHTVAEDLAAPWTCAAMARLVGVGSEQLRRQCRARYGVSPMRRLTELRLAQAAGILRATDLPVAAIAATVGYRNPYAFSTAFRRYAGISPVSWRIARRR